MMPVLALLPFLSVDPGQAIAPQNNWYLPDDGKGGEITEKEFNKIIDDVAAIYPEGEVKIMRDWKDGTANAFAQVYDGVRYVTFYGGFARFPGMSKDSFALVVCHEFGHHLGGRPRMTGSWASAEGQADYFGAEDCLRQYLVSNPPAENEEFESMDYIDQSCADAYGKDDAKITACVRGAIAGEDLSVALAKLEGFINEFPSLLTPSEYQVGNTIRDKYPSVQCRLDTYFNGALGLERPRCWYKN